MAQFFRIILDEAQNIRTRKTKVSRASNELNATYRWALTGYVSSRSCFSSRLTPSLPSTPIINSLSDMYGIIRFLKIRPWYDWAEFNEHIALKEKRTREPFTLSTQYTLIILLTANLAVTRLQTILATFQLRRTKQSKLNGKLLIELPEKKIELTKLAFSEDELAIYKMVSAPGFRS